MGRYAWLTWGGSVNLVDKDMIKKGKVLNEMLMKRGINVWVCSG